MIYQKLYTVVYYCLGGSNYKICSTLEQATFQNYLVICNHYHFEFFVAVIFGSITPNSKKSCNIIQHSKKIFFFSKQTLHMHPEYVCKCYVVKISNFLSLKNNAENRPGVFFAKKKFPYNFFQKLLKCSVWFIIILNLCVYNLCIIEDVANV